MYNVLRAIDLLSDVCTHDSDQEYDCHMTMVQRDLSSISHAGHVGRVGMNGE